LGRGENLTEGVNNSYNVSIKQMADLADHQLEGKSR